MKAFYRFIWNVSDFLHIPLGRFAPFVFGKMIGASSKKRRKE